LPEYFNGRVVGSVDEEFASPIEQIVLTGIQMSSGLIFVGRGEKLSIFFLYLAQ
jgi:hypothetical protein